MGMFSWITSDTNRPITVKGYGKTFTVYLLSPTGEKYREDNYAGYGDFGGVDAYEMVARWNAADKCGDPEREDRCIGIDIACHDYQNASLKFPIKIVESPDISYEDAKPSRSDPDQGMTGDDEDNGQIICPNCGEIID